MAHVIAGRGWEIELTERRARELWALGWLVMLADGTLALTLDGARHVVAGEATR